MAKGSSDLAVIEETAGGPTNRTWEFAGNSNPGDVINGSVKANFDG